MTSKADYTHEEWNLLKDPLDAVGFAVALADKSGLDTIQEVKAISSAWKRARGRFALNDLIQALLADVRRQGGLGEQRLMRSKNSERFKAETLAICRQVADLLERKASAEEAADYKHLVMMVGEQVAKTAHEAGAEQPVSTAEAAILQEISDALRLVP
jgi:hypothetical protein